MTQECQQADTGYRNREDYVDSAITARTVEDQPTICAAATVSVVFFADFPAHEPLDVHNGHCAVLACVHQLFRAGSCPLRDTHERGLG